MASTMGTVASKDDHSEFSVRKSAIPDFIQFFEAAEYCHGLGRNSLAMSAAMAAAEATVAAAEAAVAAKATARASANAASKSTDSAIAANGTTAVTAHGPIVAGPPKAAAIATVAATHAISATTTTAVTAPAIARPIEPAIPSEARGAERPEVRVGAPAPDPRCRQPHPPVGGVVRIGVRAVVVGHAFVGVLVSVRHPNPTILACVYPLAGACRLCWAGSLLNLLRSFALAWAGGWWRLLRWHRGSLARRCRGWPHLF